MERYDENGTRDQVEAERALATLARQRDEYRALHGLAQQQRALVTSNEPESLLSVLAERQKHVDRLTELNGEVKRLSRDWPDLYGAMSERQRDQAETMLREVRACLAEIIAGDEEDARLLSARMAGVRDQSAALAESRRAYAAYGTAAVQAARTAGYTDGRLIDEVDEQA